MITAAERTTVLEQWIRYYTGGGYQLRYRDATTAQLERSQPFNWPLAILLFLLCVIPFFVYLLWGATGTHHAVTIQVMESGEVLINGQAVEIDDQGQVRIRA